MSRFRNWRDQAGLSLTEVADLTGVSTAMLSRIERGKRTPSPMMRVQIARRLGVRVAELFDVDDLDLDEAVGA